jgi:hypothetical protein
MVKTSVVLLLSVLTLGAIGLSPILSPMAASVLPSTAGGECGECHGSFVAFEVEGDYPEVITLGDPQTIRLKISNPWKHEISSCSATIDLSEASIIDFSDADNGSDPLRFDGTVSRGTEVGFTFEVNSHTLSARIALNYDPRSVDLTDLDLSVESPNGEIWTAPESSNEVVELGSADFDIGGTGDYTVFVQHARGLRSASFTVDMMIDNGPMRSDTQNATGIGPGESHTFEWNVIAKGEGSGNIGFDVMADVHHDHESEEEDGKEVTDDAVYELEGSLSVHTGDEVKYSTMRSEGSPGVDGWVLGRVFAFIAASSFILSILLGGTIGPLKRTFDNLLGSDRRKRIHCMIAYVAISSVAVHVILLYTGLYSGTLKGLLLGGIALSGMIALALTGSFSRILTKRIGERAWKMIHLGLTILVLVVFTIHAVTGGTEFAFLR